MKVKRGAGQVATVYLGEKVNIANSVALKNARIIYSENYKTVKIDFGNKNNRQFPPGRF